MLPSGERAGERRLLVVLVWAMLPPGPSACASLKPCKAEAELDTPCDDQQRACLTPWSGTLPGLADEPVIQGAISGNG